VILATHRRRAALAGTTSLELALDDADALDARLAALRPDVVIHTAGMASVDACEREPERAHHVNGVLAGNVATAAARVGARLVHISTDHLFSGTRAFYTEDATPEPLNAYGRSKLAAEQRVAAACPDALVIRTNFFAWGHRYRQSISDWIHASLAAGRTLSMFDDVFVTPILADELARLTHRLLDLGASGIYNVVGEERISKYDLAQRIAATWGFPGALVRRGKIAASQLEAQRPHDMSLDNRKSRERLGTSLGNIADYLRLLQEQERAGRRGELAAAVTE
jgi:dTDP-4-dehydrorhamnose reductase